jgi:hypothetical protein
MPKPKGSSPAFKRMTQAEVDGYHEYVARHRAKQPQTEASRAGNTAYARSMRQERMEKARVEQVRGEGP